LLFETNMQSRMDEVWLVTASEDMRIKRIMSRDKIDEANARKRLLSQMPQEEKEKHASVILDNTGDIKALHVKVDALYQTALERNPRGTTKP
ncbi:dephospho-CoA kinase, partial [Christensenellaceae bacterium OttesenSCG-928-M15]|nr:dephospho-CoA kinase [Christensenellaceae bacterium OttesenSCG-928-M15]